MSSTQYDEIAAEYDAVETFPGQKVIIRAMEEHKSILKGKTVVDLACGTGRWTRWAMDNGALSVTGIDISTKMVEIAKAQNTYDGRIQYHIQDCSEPFTSTSATTNKLVAEPVDVVMATWLLNYAPDEETQLRMWQNIANLLKPGGKFIALIPDLDVDLTDPPFEPKYGVHTWKLEDVNVGRDDHGHKLRRQILMDPPVSFDGYELNRGVYQRCAKKVGMKDVKFDQSYPLPDGYPEGFWDALKKTPVMELITATKA